MKDKSYDELRYIIKDASEAAACARDLGNYQAECKYLDQVNDACTELYRRRGLDKKGQIVVRDQGLRDAFEAIGAL